MRSQIHLGWQRGGDLRDGWRWPGAGARGALRCLRRVVVAPWFRTASYRVMVRYHYLITITDTGDDGFNVPAYACDRAVIECRRALDNALTDSAMLLRPWVNRAGATGSTRPKHTLWLVSAI